MFVDSFCKKGAIEGADVSSIYQRTKFNVHTFTGASFASTSEV
jgi:hypothetical protein